MNPFTFVKPASARHASREVTSRAKVSLAVLKAGGMDLFDHMKEGLLSPAAIIDVKRLRPEGAGGAGGVGGAGVEAPFITFNQADNTLSIEAGATLAAIASSELVHAHAPALAQAAADAATPQVRNVASIAGNLLQRPRCWYYRHQQFHCLKKGGSECFAVDGENRYHAIFGRGPCVIVHPSNLAVPLSIMDAVVHYQGADPSQDGQIAIADLFHVPHLDVRSEHTLPAGAVVTAITLAAAPKSGFSTVKEKQSFDWPLVMVAARVELDGSTIADCAVCAGAVAPVPWPLPEVAKALVGVSIDDEAAITRACALAAEGATPLRDNGYKVQLLPVVVKRALYRAAGKSEGGRA